MTNTSVTQGRDQGRVTAILGPTNTGKTHLAIDRMMGHRSGMIGFPLRLLARENYERIVRIKGAGAVALITGEEKILPPHAKYFVCTVESMPLDRRVAFLAIDEIQLCADPDRGHVFTDRLLHARGEDETMLLGAETIKPLIRRLVPGVEFITRPRFSTLTYAGPKKLTRLPPRSAIVAFSAADVYAMAEFVRRQRGGAAVVLGALSPRTRNAQVGLYQSGEVDYLVATDAIGMGLNMDVDHVAFAGLRKFDGRVPRPLDATEIAQIAGRAGRHMNDGTFGTTGDSGGIAPELVNAVENHVFPPLRGLYWRNSKLRFTSVAALLGGLSMPPDQPGLMRAREADDHLALQALSQDAELMRRTAHPERVRLMWDVCQIPDFRKVMGESHIRLLGQIYRHLTDPDEVLPDDWLNNHVERLDRSDGEIDTIIQRIANIRTWTYVAHRADWLRDPVHWQERTRAVEDRLSDSLHERLTQRFVDRRTAMLLRRLKDKDTALLSAVDKQGDVLVEGHFVGRLDGFCFVADAAETAHGARAVSAAAQRALRTEILARVRRLCTEPDEAFALDEAGIVLWQASPVAILAAGSEPWRPGIEVLASDMLEPAERDRVKQRLTDWLTNFLNHRLAPLFAARDAGLTGAARGLIFQLAEALGSLPRIGLEPQLRGLTEPDRKALARLGIRFGVESVFMPALLKPASLHLRGLLWRLRNPTNAGAKPRFPAPGRVSVPADQDAGFLEAVGYRVVGKHAIRIDILERFAAEIRTLARHDKDGFTPAPALASMIGVKSADLPDVLAALGYGPKPGDENGRFVALRHGTLNHAKKPRNGRSKKGRGHSRPNADSPFAVLAGRV